MIENKGDYVEAFTCQLNYEPMKKGIFRWLDATLEFLKSENIKFRKMLEKEEEMTAARASIGGLAISFDD